MNWTPETLLRKGRSAYLRGMQRALSLLRRMWILFTRGVRVPWTTTIGASVDVRETDGGQILLGAGSALNRGSMLIAQGGRICIGRGCFVGFDSIIVSQICVSIGENVLIAERVTIRDQDHSIHGAEGLPISHSGFVSAPIVIGDGAWIAAGAVILKGVAIGKGAVVAANSVVNRDVEDFEIVGGAPARHIGVRKGDGEG